MGDYLPIFISVNEDPLLHRIKETPATLREGIRWRIPGCCIFFYIIDGIMGRPPGVLRGSRNHKYGVYVPCPFHMDKNYKPPVRLVKDGKMYYPQQARIRAIRRAPVV